MNRQTILIEEKVLRETELVAAMKPAAWTTDNKSGLKRFSHAERFKRALALVDPRDGDRVLDYGCSDGYFLELINSAGAKLSACGYDPWWSNYKIRKETTPATRGIRFTDDLGVLENGSFDKIACLEVLEHLEVAALRTALENIKRLLAGDGFAVISVPVEIGLSSLLKNAVRVITGQAHDNTTPLTVTKSLLKMSVERRGDGSYILSHVGFDFRELERDFGGAGFDIVKRTFSPFPALGRYLNSQVFYVLRASDGRAHFK